MTPADDADRDRRAAPATRSSSSRRATTRRTRDPVGIAFTGTAYSEAKLLAFGYAYEQATKLRKPPSEINPSLWRCVPGNAYTVTTRACAPNEPANADVIAGTVSGTVPATLVADARHAGDLRRVHAGRGDGTYTASTTANVISTAGDATLSVADPSSNATGRLVNGVVLAGAGAAGAREQRRLARSAVEDATPAVRSPTTLVTITFRQAIGANEPLRTGAYAKTLTFTLSTTNP